MMSWKHVNGCLIKEVKTGKIIFRYSRQTEFFFYVRLKLPVILIRKLLRILLKFYSSKGPYCIFKMLTSPFGPWIQTKLPVILRMAPRYFLKNLLNQLMILKRLNYIRTVAY